MVTFDCNFSVLVSYWDTFLHFSRFLLHGPQNDFPIEFASTSDRGLAIFAHRSGVQTSIRNATHHHASSVSLVNVGFLVRSAAKHVFTHLLWGA